MTMNRLTADILDVAAGVVVSPTGAVLIAQRPGHVHQGGLWEFPGGKLEHGETALQALQRELEEELGIGVAQAEPLITLRHDYPDQRVCLHVFRVQQFSGMPRGLQGQPVRWVAKDELREWPFPAANRPIVAAARLPDRYAILEAETEDVAVWLERLALYAERGIELIRLRASRLSADRYRRLAREAAPFCVARGIKLLLNGPPQRVMAAGAAGLHLRSDELMSLCGRPVARDYWLAASCHNLEQLQQAARVGVDFAVLGPVAATATHPGAPVMGWEVFARLAAAATLPVFALGGLGESHLAQAKQAGAQGVAAIRGFLEGAAP